MLKQMSQLEAQIMDIIWSSRNCCVKEVHEKISEKRNIAYTTVLTIVKRLYEKGFVSRIKQKNAYIYSPKISRESHAKDMTKRFVANFINTYGDAGIVFLADAINELPPIKRNLLVEFIKTRKNNS